MKNISIKSILLFMTMLPFFVQAQSVDNVLRSNGRIYVVIAVILIILVGLFLYLGRIERKINRLKKHNEK